MSYFAVLGDILAVFFKNKETKQAQMIGTKTRERATLTVV